MLCVRDRISFSITTVVSIADGGTETFLSLTLTAITVVPRRRTITEDAAQNTQREGELAQRIL